MFWNNQEGVMKDQTIISYLVKQYLGKTIRLIETFSLSYLSIHSFQTTNKFDMFTKIHLTHLQNYTILNQRFTHKLTR